MRSQFVSITGWSLFHPFVNGNGRHGRIPEISSRVIDKDPRRIALADEPIDGDPMLDLPSRAEFEAWLEEQSEDSRAVWLRLAKKGSEFSSITADETVDVGLCFGWVSAVRRRYDDNSYLQRYTRRRPDSRWSRINIAKVDSLMQAGLMRFAGIAEVEAAQADGRWDNPWT